MMTDEKKEKKLMERYTKEELEKLIQKLVKEGHAPSKIGLILRDQYGVPDVSKYGIKLSTVASSEVPEDLYNLLVKVVRLHVHMVTSRKDFTSKHGLEKMESKIRRLGKYYIRKGKLPADWKYTIEDAKLLVK